MEQQAATYLFQQAPAVVVCICVAALCMLAIRALFRDAKEERAAAAAALKEAQDACREERKQDRAELGAQLRELGGHVGALGEAVAANTQATQRLADRMTPTIRAA